MISIQPFFVLLFLCRAVAGKCVDIDLQLVNSAKRMFDRAASLRLSGKFDAELNVFNLELDFSPPLLLNEDYKLEPVHPYKLPVPYQKDSKLNSFRVLLKPGRTWSKTNITGENEDDGKTTNIMLQGARYCDARPTNGSGKTMQPVHLATVNPLSVYKCPKLFNMTRVSAEFQSYIDGILTHCQVPKVITIGQLAIKKISPLSLLYLQPPVLFIDARRGNKLRRSARIIDTFLASHSVLDVVWEPLNATEPLWWVLMPKPMGMPGKYSISFPSIQVFPDIHDRSSLRHDGLSAMEASSGDECSRPVCIELQLYQRVSRLCPWLLFVQGRRHLVQWMGSRHQSIRRQPAALHH